MEDTKAAKVKSLREKFVYHLLVSWWRSTRKQLRCRRGGAHVLLVLLNPPSHRRTLCLQLAEVDSPGAVTERLLCARSRHLSAWNINQSYICTLPTTHNKLWLHQTRIQKGMHKMRLPPKAFSIWEMKHKSLLRTDHAVSRWLKIKTQRGKSELVLLTLTLRSGKLKIVFFSMKLKFQIDRGGRCDVL